VLAELKVAGTQQKNAGQKQKKILHMHA
jgi:hypothetical protein